MAAKPEAKEKKPTEKTAKKPAEKKAQATQMSGTVKNERDKSEKKQHHKARVERSEKHCEVKGCKQEYRAKGYCRSHYKKWRQGEFGHRRYTSCSSTSCFKPTGKNRHGYCEDHYQSYYVKGMAVAKESVAEKPEKVVKTEEKAAEVA